MTKQEMQAIVDKIRYKNWRFIIGDKNGALYLQIKFDAPDNYTGIIEEQSCRKYMLSEHMVKTEILDAAFLAVQRAELHEVGESFWYEDVLPYCPHMDIDARVEMMKAGRIDVRP